MAEVPVADPAPLASSEPLAEPGKLNILELPEEIQKEICGHCSQSDLICLALVSTRFRELAAVFLYRKFHIVFPDDDDPCFDSPIDGLASGLDTFVTSDYNYAQHLRDLSLDTLSAGDKGELACKPYQYNVSCGKFMNTLLHLTLLKADKLETFRWNIRVELSRPVYKVLHKVQTLKHLHIRLQAGPSLYEAPPPLPYTGVPTPELPPPPPHPNLWHGPVTISPPMPDPFPVYIPGSGNGNILPVGNQIPNYGPPPPLPPPTPLVKPKSKMPKKATTTKEPPTLSGFKHLKSLSVLDIENLDEIKEIKTCVRNSSSTLRKLKLSFSDALASQARKPSPENDSEDSDVEDDFQVAPISSSYNDDGSGPAKAFRAQEERKFQEGVLGRIFDIEPYIVKKPPAKATENKKTEEVSSTDPGKEYIAAMKKVSSKLVAVINGGGPETTQTQQEVLDLLEKAARKYVDSEHQSDKPQDDLSGEQIPRASSSQSHSTNATDDQQIEDPNIADNGGSNGLFESKTPPIKGNGAESNPEDIDIEAPEESNLLEQTLEQPDEAANDVAQPVEASASTDTPVEDSKTQSSPELDHALEKLALQKVNYQTLSKKLGSCEDQADQIYKQIQNARNPDGSTNVGRLNEAKKQLQDFSRDMKDVQHDMHIVEAELEDAEDQAAAIIDADEREILRRRRQEYSRKTRGIALESLSIHLIPVKASVLGRAVDLSILKEVTLLNVGPQAPFWTLMTKGNRIQSLPLRKISTDNVSLPFLQFTAQLECLEDCFLLERSTKYRPESFAPRAKITLDQIRRLLLKKHMQTLKRFGLRNEADGAWDVDEKTISLICSRGRELEELAVSMGIKAIHAFLQYLSGLTNLRALHIVAFRNDDTCVWVMRETRKFIVDTVSHHPELKLEWIAMDEDHAERIIRRTENPKPKLKSKGKEKATGISGGLSNGIFPSFPLDNWDAELSDSDDEDDHARSGLKLETEPMQFYEVWGVEIFSKEVLSGRL